MAGWNADIQTPGRIDNTSGLIWAGNALDLSAASVINRDTLHSQDEAIRGIHGRTVELRAGIIDNSTGKLDADDGLSIDGKRLSNVAGEVTSRGDAVFTLGSEAGKGNTQASRGGKRTRRSVDSAAGDTSATDVVLDNQRGNISVSKDARLDLDGGLDNRAGRVQAEGRLYGRATDVNNQGGALVGDEVDIKTPGEIDNRGGLIESRRKLDLSAARILNGNTKTSETAPTLGIVGETVSLQAPVIDNVGGTVIADHHVTVNGKRLDNSGGLVKAWNGVNLLMSQAAAQAAEAQARTRRALPDVQIQVHAQDKAQAQDRAKRQAEVLADESFVLNQNGRIVSGGDVKAELGRGSLNNESGTLASGKTFEFEGATFHNSGGKAQARDVTIKAADRIDNKEGLIEATEKVALAADTVNNARTKDAATASSDEEASATEASVTDAGQGILGKTVSIDARTTNNSEGHIGATDRLDINSETVRNNEGLASSHGTAALRANTVENEGGELWSSKGMSIKADRLTGIGNIESQGDIKVRTEDTLVNNGKIVADGELSVAVENGNIDNAGTLSSGGDADIDARQVNNSGRIISGGKTGVRAKERINNAGLINGVVTALEAPSIDNSSRVYGDWIEIGADTLRNAPRPGDTGANRKAGVIAAHHDVDIGVRSFDNDHGQVYAGGDLGIGGHLNEHRKAAGKANVVNNRAGLIDVDGNLRVNAEIINNLNEHFVTEIVPGTTTHKVYYRRNGKDEKLDAEQYWLCNYDKPVCTKNYKWVLKTSQRRLLMPSSKYPESQYGPEFPYAIQKHENLNRGQAPIKHPYTPPSMQPSGADSYVAVPEKFHYPIDAPIWDVFEVPRPAPLPDWKPTVEGQKCDEACLAAGKAYEKAHKDKVAAYEELNKRVYAFNRDFKRRLVSNFTIYDVNETVSESRVVASDPGRILVGGDATFDGRVLNDKSQIIAGGRLHTVGDQVQNIGATGERRIETQGQIIRTHTGRRGRKHKTLPYEGAPVVESFEMPVMRYVDQTAKPAGTWSVPTSNPQGASAAPFETFSLNVPGVGVVRTVTPTLSLPNSPLYNLTPAGSAGHLINTDPDFMGGRAHISSDYLFELLRSRPAGDGRMAGGSPRIPAQPDPLRNARPPSGPARVEGFNGELLLKRLGDGFYEQRLVANQIMAVTGQRFIGDYRDNQSQYKALLAAGADVGKQHGLTVGTALTEEQMRRLTSDMVWMVKRDVKLADGTTQTVLAPQVYLMVQEGDLKGDGTLMAGRRVKMDAHQRVENNGTIAARDTAAITAKNIVLRDGGSVRADTVYLWAQEDLDNRGALVRGRKVLLGAGRDINVMSTLGESTAGGSATAATPGAKTAPYVETWRTYISGLSRIEAEFLTLDAGRDANFPAARVNVEGDADIKAGRDITLSPLREKYGESVYYKKRNNSRVEHTTDVGTAIRADGNLNLSSGRDLTATAADVTAGGTLAVDAGRDINLLDGHETGYARDELYVKYKSGWATVRKHRIDTEESDQSRASTFTGDSVQMKAGRDILVRGSNVGAQNDLTLAAERDLTIVAGENTAVEDHYRKEKRTGWGATGGLSNGMRQITTTLEGVGVTYTPSVVGSVDGNVGMQAEGSVAVKGSQVLANKGNIDITGRDIDVAPVIARDREKHFHEFKESGFRISVGVPLVNAIEKIERMAEASSQVDNPIMKAIAAGAMGGIVANTVAEAVVNEGSAESPASMTITLDYGAIRTASTVNRNSTDVVGSTMQAGQDLTLTAKGAGQDSNITVTGSTLSAGGKVMLDAEGDLKLQAAASTAEQRTDHSHFDGKIGVGVMLGASGGAVGYGFVVKGSIAASQGWTEGMRTEWVNTHVKGKDVFMRSGGDTLMRGAQVRGKRIDSNIRGNLLMESPQDEHTYNAEDMSANAGFTLCYGYCTSSGYASAGYGQMNSLYKSVREQTGMWAGEDGFDIYVGKNTKLKGAVIAGDDRAVAAGVNRLNTGTLEMEDIKNVAKYDAFQVSAGMGGGAGGKGAGGGGGGVGMTMPGGALAFDQARSTTYSAISGGHLTIRDLEGQVALTGDTVEEMLASVDRDTSNTNHVLKPIFDCEKVQAGLDIVTEATKQAGAFLANKAKEADAIKTELDKTPEGPKRDALLARYAEAAKWGNGGTYRRALTAVLAAASGNVAAGAGQFVLSATVNYLQALGAETIKELAKHIGGEGSPAHIALHSILACSGAAAQGANCGAGALGASSSIVLGQLISKATEKKAENLTAAEREQRTQLIVDLVTGIGSALDARTAPTAITAARTELENNSMVMPPLQSGVAGGALGAVGTSGNKRVLNNQERQMELLGQGTADQGTTTSSISWGLDGIYEWLFGAPAEPVPPTGPLVNPAAQDADVGTPGRPGQLLEPVLLPGQANEGPHEGLTTSMPLPEPSGPILILQEAEATGSGSITIDEARARHIFRDAEGHISDTPINRRLLENIANDPSAVLGTDKYGTTWAARLNPDGTQTWVGIRGGKVSYGGINHTQKSFHSETGLASPTRPGRER